MPLRKKIEKRESVKRVGELETMISDLLELTPMSIVDLSRLKVRKGGGGGD